MLLMNGGGALIVSEMATCDRGEFFGGVGGGSRLIG